MTDHQTGRIAELEGQLANSSKAIDQWQAKARAAEERTKVVEEGMAAEKDELSKAQAA